MAREKRGNRCEKHTEFYRNGKGARASETKGLARLKESAHHFFFTYQEFEQCIVVVTAFAPVFCILICDSQRSDVGFVHAQFLGNSEEDEETKI